MFRSELTEQHDAARNEVERLRARAAEVEPKQTLSTWTRRLHLA